MKNNDVAVEKRAKRPRIIKNNMYTPQDEPTPFLEIRIEKNQQTKKRRKNKRRKIKNNMYTPPFSDQKLSREISGMFDSLFRSGTKGLDVILKPY